MGESVWGLGCHKLWCHKYSVNALTSGDSAKDEASIQAQAVGLQGSGFRQSDLLPPLLGRQSVDEPLHEQHMSYITCLMAKRTHSTHTVYPHGEVLL